MQLRWHSLGLVTFVVACSGSGGGLVSDGGSDEEVAALILTTAGVSTLGTTAVVLTTSGDRAPSVYLENRRQIEIDLARGSGGWIEDVADELGLPEGLLKHLGATLKRYRDPLTALLRTKVRVTDWERALAVGLCCDPWIRPFAAQRFGCTGAAAGAATPSIECAP